MHINRHTNRETGAWMDQYTYRYKSDIDVYIDFFHNNKKIMKPNLKAQFEPLLGLLLSRPLVALLNSDQE